MRGFRYILQILFGLTVMAGLGYGCFVPRVSVGHVRQEVEEQLPLGTLKADVETWLKSRGISYGGIIEGASGRQIGIGGRLHGTGPLISQFHAGSTEIRVEFHFDEHGGLSWFSVEEFTYYL
jgi:hypothetical protein